VIPSAFTTLFNIVCIYPLQLIPGYRWMPKVSPKENAKRNAACYGDFCF